MFNSQLSHLEQGSAPPRSGIFKYSIVIECCESWTYFSLTEGLRLSQVQPLMSTDCGCTGQMTAQVLLFAHYEDCSEITDALRSNYPYYTHPFWLFCLGSFGFTECR